MVRVQAKARVRRRRARREGRERGFVIVWMAIVLVLLLSIAALAVDLVHAYAVAQHLQNAVDAAALGGAAELPNAVGSTADAKLDSSHLLASNGFDPNDSSGDNKLITNDRNPVVSNEMDVEMSTKIPTLFAWIMGFDSITVRKKAHAQYDVPLAMGSPANNIGRVPPGSCTQVGYAIQLRLRRACRSRTTAISRCGRRSKVSTPARAAATCSRRPDARARSRPTAATRRRPSTTTTPPRTRASTTRS